MPPRSLSSSLRCCRQCRLAPFRHFHDTSYRAADESQPSPSRRQAARDAQFQEIENLPRSVVRRVALESGPSASQYNRSAAPRPMTTGPSSGDNDQRTALPRDPARGGMRGQRGGGMRGRGGAAAAGGSMRGNRGGGSMRGGRGGDRGRGRGARRKDSGRPRPDEDETDGTKEIEAALEEGRSEADKLIDRYGDAFAMPEEAHNYGQVMELLTAWKALQARRANFETYKDSPTVFGHGGGAPLNAAQIAQMTATLDAQERDFDALIAQALASLVSTDAKFLPHHTPAEGAPTATPSAGLTGGVPTSPTGTAAVLEEALRAVARRQTMEWQDPKVLAQDLLAGRFVKFRDYVEKSSVVRLAEEMQWQEGQRYRDEHVGFREPDERGKAELLRALVSGRYAASGEAPLHSAFLKDAVRRAHFNGSYGPRQKEVLVRTLAQMMPQGQGHVGSGQTQAPQAQNQPASS